MKHGNGKIGIAGLALILSVAAPGPAHAYIDSGTGTMIAQLLAGGLAGGLFVLKLYYRSAKRTVRIWMGKDPEPQDPAKSSG